MIEEQVLTHKGWFGLCPVYIGDIDAEGPFLEPRHWTLAWLLPVSAYIYQGLMHLMELAGQDGGGFPIRVTGVLPKPMVVQWESD